MRTNIAVDDRLLADAQAVTGQRNMRPPSRTRCGWWCSYIGNTASAWIWLEVVGPAIWTPCVRTARVTPDPAPVAADSSSGSGISAMCCQGSCGVSSGPVRTLRSRFGRRGCWWATSSYWRCCAAPGMSVALPAPPGIGGTLPLDPCWAKGWQCRWLGTIGSCVGLASRSARPLTCSLAPTASNTDTNCSTTIGISSLCG